MFAPSDYRFELPTELIAQEPAAQRDASRLLHLHAGGALSDHAFAEIIELLPADAVIVANDTRVIPARVLGHKDTGGAIELLFLEPADEVGAHAWRCLAKGTLRPGMFVAAGDVRFEVLAPRAQDGSIVVGAPPDLLAFLDAHGHIPLPHYIERDDRADDRERYQTMFARVPGAIAAPTAGLHMTPAIRDRLVARGGTFATLTLHVGWGTFAPIRVDDVRHHVMHRERYAISDELVRLVASGRPVVALGTTALRALEAAATGDKQLRAGQGSTDIFIYPGAGHAFRIVDHLITNFHLPESTLLMLVCAFAGTERVLAAYRHAVAQRYRFFSYGDASLLHRA
ncbi:MAG: tRNA preQ1(34) S-adenosylmethionine ribosyltransferase-isomerase QueA [Kofleriaceae bacterium]